MFLADDVRIELARGRVERIDRRIDAERRDVARQHDRRVQVAERRRRRRIGQVVGGNVDGLDRRDRSGLGRRDALLQRAHLRSQRRLVADRRRHAAEQRGHFGSGQRVAVDVVDEEQHVAALVAKVLGHRQAGQRDAQPVAGRLVHLAVDHRHLVEDVRVLHLVIEVVALARALADAGEHRVAGMLGGDIADQLQHVDRLADAGAAEQAHLAAFGERAHQVDDLDAGFQQLGRRRQLLERRRVAMDRHRLFRADRAGFVDRPAEHVHDPAERLRARPAP